MGNLAVQENSPKELKSETIRRAVSQASTEQFEKAMNDKDISVAIAIKIKQDSISNEIMKCYDQMIELQKH